MCVQVCASVPFKLATSGNVCLMPPADVLHNQCHDMAICLNLQEQFRSAGRNAEQQQQRTHQYLGFADQLQNVASLWSQGAGATLRQVTTYFSTTPTHCPSISIYTSALIDSMHITSQELFSYVST